MKKPFLIIFFATIIGLLLYEHYQSNYFQLIDGDWQITKAYHNSDNLQDDQYVIVGFFEKPDQLWLVKNKPGKDNEHVYANYKLYKSLDTLRLKITKCSDNRFNKNFNLYLDTIENSDNQFLIRLTLDSENTFIQAIKPKIRY
ncbi:MAG: hypothetical protein EOP00_27775 [Pedobacter sp.]|nr:MAG: hypothetical protein EOP00_27775 [Pedobacter sp.]